MSRHNSKSQTRLDVGNEESIVIDVEGAPDEMYRSLVNERRRILLCVLARTTGQTSVAELAEAVARREQPVESAHAETGLQERVRISLYHNHLPTLAQGGLIEFDPESMVVEDVADEIRLVTA